MGPDYCLRPLQQPLYVFAIDVSRRAVQSGSFVASLRAVHSALDQLPGGAAARAGIFTFSDQIHFYSVREGAGLAADPSAVSLYIADSDDPVAALPDRKWLLSLHTQREQLQLLLRKIPELIPHIQNRAGNSEPSRSCPTAAIKAGQLALDSSGGRVIVLTAAHPSAGLGKMRNREQSSLYGSQHEFSMYGSTDVLLSTLKTPDDKACLQIYR